MVIILTNNASPQWVRLINRPVPSVNNVQIQDEASFLIELSLNTNPHTYHAVKRQSQGAVFIINTF